MATTNGTTNGTPLFDRAYRINELNNIESQITSLLFSASSALTALTQTSPPSTSGTPNTTHSQPARDDLDTRKELFRSATASYFSALSTIDIHLRRQIYALEEANIIPPELGRELPANVVAAVPVQDGVEEGPVTKAGPPGLMGQLDVGWLNSRGDGVGREMRAELWKEMKRLVEAGGVGDLFSGDTGIPVRADGEDKIMGENEDAPIEDNILSGLERYLDGQMAADAQAISR